MPVLDDWLRSEGVVIVALYLAEDGETPIITHSMLKSFKRCPRQAMYKYADRLKPKMTAKPLRRGTWIHSLLETHHKGGNWKETHADLTAKFNGLFEEEQEMLGDLPTEIGHVMSSYFWHYQDDRDWTVIELDNELAVEHMLEVKLPEGTIYRCRTDVVVETEFGLYIVDNKSHRTLPNIDFRLKDPQSALYIWAYQKAGIPIQGFIWNYIKYSPPKPLRFNLNGELSKRQGETDYPTAYRSIKAQGYDPRDFRSLLLPLQRRRYVHGAPQLSPFFKRSTLEKDEEMLKRVLRESLHTTKRSHTYPFHKRDYVERTVDRSCDWCSYKDLCTVELFGGNRDQVIRTQFKQGDPMDYYYDQKDTNEE